MEDINNEVTEESIEDKQTFRDKYGTMIKARLSNFDFNNISKTFGDELQFIQKILTYAAYLAGVWFAESLWLGVIKAAFPADPIFQKVAYYGVFATGLSSFLLMVSKEYWRTNKTAYRFAWIFWTTIMAIVSLNAALSFQLTMVTPSELSEFFKGWLTWSPATPVVSTIGWGILFALSNAPEDTRTTEEKEAEQRKVAQGAALLVYVGVVLYADMMFISVIEGAFPKGSLLYALAFSGALATGISSIAVLWAKMYWVTNTSQQWVAWIFWIVETIALGANANLAFSLQNAGTIQDLTGFAAFWSNISPATPLIALLGWGLLFFFDDANRIRMAKFSGQAKMAEELSLAMTEAANSPDVKRALSLVALNFTQEFIIHQSRKQLEQLATEGDPFSRFNRGGIVDYPSTSLNDDMPDVLAEAIHTLETGKGRANGNGNGNGATIPKG